MPTVSNFRTMLRRNCEAIFSAITETKIVEHHNGSDKLPNGAWRLIDVEVTKHPKTEGRSREVLATGMVEITIEADAHARELQDAIDVQVDIVQRAVDAATQFATTYEQGRRRGGMKSIELVGWHPRINLSGSGKVSGPLYLSFEIVAWLERR